jgi:hypothetical protein
MLVGHANVAEVFSIRTHLAEQAPEMLAEPKCAYVERVMLENLSSCLAPSHSCEVGSKYAEDAN